MLPIKAYAVYDVTDSRCTTDTKIFLLKQGLNVTYSVNKNIVNNETKYNLEILNINKYIYVTNNINKNIYREDSTIENINPGTKVILYVYATDATYCEGYKANTINIQIPYYNIYSTNSLCKGYETYALCNETSNINITEKEFEIQMKAYIESLKNNNNEKEETTDDTTTTNNFDIINFVVKYNIYISSFGVLLLIGYIVYMINKMNKERGIL